MRIAVTGNMGVGKTTLCRFISLTKNLKYVSESENTNPFLSLAYEDRSQFNFMLQLQFLFQRFSDNHKFSGQSAVFDRTFYDGPEVFVPVHEAMGNLTFDQSKLISFGYESLKAKVTPPDKLVFLSLPYQLCIERLKIRNDSYLNKINPEFIERLGEEYENFYHRYEFDKVRIGVSDVDLRLKGDAQEVANLIFCEDPKRND